MDVRGTSHAQSFGFFLVCVGSLAFLSLSMLAVARTAGSLMDFRPLFYSARCLLLHSDPYDSSNVLHVFHTEGGDQPSDSDDDRRLITRYLYPPTQFLITVPFALFPFTIAQALWIAVTAGSFIVASFLMWDLSATTAPEVGGVLLCFLLANAEQIVVYGNPAGIAIGLCVISVWCFFRDRFAAVGICCLAASLAVKPHDAAFIWLFFLLSPGINRRRALLTFLVLIALTVPLIVLLTNISPHWIAEMRCNWTAMSVPGGTNDPGPRSFMNHGTARITDLQSAFSVYRDDARFYNLASYVVCAPLLLMWIIITLRSRPSLRSSLLALASIAPLSMLPIYHRIYDAKLIMLTIPACALLCSEGGRLGRIALVITAAGLVASADLVWSFYIGFLIQSHLLTPVQPGPLMSAALAFPLPLAMLTVGTFYLWLYAQQGHIHPLRS